MWRSEGSLASDADAMRSDRRCFSIGSLGMSHAGRVPGAGHPGRSDPQKSWHVGRKQAHNVFLQGGPSEKKSGVHTSKPQAAAAFFFFSAPNFLKGFHVAF